MDSKRNVDQKLPPGDPRALGHATNIDRRTCHRVVPMGVLGMGLSRTGTASLRQALIDLGYSDCYHFASVLNENPRDADMWIEAYEAKFEGKGSLFSKGDFDQLLGHCMLVLQVSKDYQAITDKPCINFASELFEAYPEAKVILTVRDSPEQWHKSMEGTLIPYKENVVEAPRSLIGRIMQVFQPAQTSVHRLSELIVKYDDTYNDDSVDWVTRYKRHNEKIISMVPKEKLLIFNVKEGWAPLCEFLEKDIPDWSFPRVNDTASFQENVAAIGHIMKQATKLNFLKSMGILAAAGVAISMYIERRRIF